MMRHQRRGVAMARWPHQSAQPYEFSVRVTPPSPRRVASKLAVKTNAGPAVKAPARISLGGNAFSEKEKNAKC